MKYRSKLYIALIATTILSTILCFGITYSHTKKIVLSELRSNVMSVAAGTAASINRDDLIRVQSSRKDDIDAYKHIQKQLQDIRDINRRNDVYVKFIYILDPVASKPGKFVYLIDAEDKTSKDYSQIDEDADEAQSANLDHYLKQVYSPSDFISDPWGKWMVGYAPIYDKNGKYLATVGVNLYATRVIAKINQLLEYGIIAFIITLIIALIGGWYLARRQTQSLQDLHQGVKEIGKGDLTKRIDILSNDEFGELAKDINTMATKLQERERLQLSFARYVSKHVMDSILVSDGQIKLTGERKKITVLFSDIRQFTHISERYKPEQIVKYLNEYFSVMVEIIFRNQGVLDKFIGDGMMVEFGVPLDDNLQELHAIQTAIEMRQGLKELCAKWKREGRNIPEIDIGIGIHTGMAVIGNIGSEKRFEYTAIGDTVNIAARIEQLTKELKAPILISQSAVNAIKDKFEFKELGVQTIRGRDEAITLYTLDINKYKI